MELLPAIEHFIEHRKTRRISPESIKHYRRLLSHWQEWRSDREYQSELTAVDLPELDRFFSYLSNDHVPHHKNSRRPADNRRGLAAESVAAYRRVMRAFWRFANSRSWLRPDQGHYFGPDGIEAVKVPEVARPTYDDSQFAAMLEACGAGESEESARDRAVLAILWESGARIAEVLSMDDDQLQLKKRRASIVGKGGYRRLIRWGPIAQLELLRYLQLRRGDEGGPVLRASGRRAGDATRLTVDVARSRFRRNAAAAGIELAAGCPFHAFRRSFIQRGLDDGLDISEVSQLAGHRSIETTMRYARRNEERLQEIYESGYIRKDRRKKM